jgi:hypothetical protein
MKLSLNTLASAILICTTFCTNGASSCGEKNTGTVINGFNTWKNSKAVIFNTPYLNVDADGAPNSYLVDGNGLSFTCDGVVAIENGQRVTPDKKEWYKKCQVAWQKAKLSGDYSGVAIFGFLKDENNKPIVQGDGDPFPGLAFISTTTISVPNTKDGTQKHEVDATTIPYVVLPKLFISKYDVKPGDIVIVYRKATNKYAFGVYADGGKLGEASVKLHEDIGNNPIIVKDGVKRAERGIDDSIITVVFPGVTTHPTTDTLKWQEEINKLGNKALVDFGGNDQLLACAN